MNGATINSFRQCLEVLGLSDRRKYLIVLALQALLGFFDLIGVAIAGVIGSLSVRGVQAQAPGNRVGSILKLLGLNDLTFQNQIAVLGLAAVLLLISKTIFSIIITRRILVFLANRSSEIASDLISRTLNQPISGLQSQNTSQFQFAMGAGISSITMGVLGVASTAIADSFLIIILAIGIFYIDPIMSLSLFLLFGGTGFILNRILSSKAKFIGDTIVRSEISAAQRISEVRSAYREIVVRDKRNFYAKEISKLKKVSMNGIAEQTFLPNISKYVFEIAILIGAVLTASFQLLTQDASHAAASLTLFLVAGSRLAPAILRIQQSAVQIQMNYSAASETLNSIEQIRKIPVSLNDDSRVQFEYSGFTPSVTFSKVTFRYPGASEAAIKEMDLTIKAGSMTAIVGSSGAGKSTFADLLLGIQDPTQGEIQISGLPPLQAIHKWPGAIGYVPQEVGIFQGTVKENLEFGLESDEGISSKVDEALEQAHLEEFVSNLRLGVREQVGERGSRLSGGQKQRLGIARALLTNPKLVIMDEATSALDAVTENDVRESIQQLKGKVTLIIIAHRLSVIRAADQVVYLNAGVVECVGTFDEVRNLVPNFDSQARIMGL